jgi:hypothetical protein
MNIQRSVNIRLTLKKNNMKLLGHICVAIAGMLFVWLGNSFVNADFNPFHYSIDGRIGMIVFYLMEQFIAQIIYSAIVYK